MKTFKYLAILLGSIFLFAACQKEMSFESGLAGNRAAGSLQNALGECQPITVNGDYLQDSLLTDSNYVTVNVNITSPGIYKITTDTVNGFYFKDSGYIGTTGVQPIKLKASGRPILQTQSDFIVTFDSSFCLFSIDVTGESVSPATFTLGSCTSTAVQGTYQTGTALNATNNVRVEVNVTTAGSYTISTGPIGGMTFRGQGVFTTTGVQLVTLQGSGTPTTAGANNFPVTAGSVTCNFSVNVTQGTPDDDVNLADSAWQFSQGNNLFHGYFEGVEVVDTMQTKFLTMIGFNLDQDTAFVVLINVGSAGVRTGAFATNINTFFSFFTGDDNGDPVYIYEADPTIQTVVTTFNITAYNATTGVIEGNFSGTARNGQGQSVPITGGKIKARIQ